MEIEIGKRTKFKIKIDEEDYYKIKDKEAYCSNGFNKKTINIRPNPDFKNKTQLKRYLTGAKYKEIVLHINGDELDLRKENLFKTTEKRLTQLIKERKIMWDELQQKWIFTPQFKQELKNGDE